MPAKSGSVGVGPLVTDRASLVPPLGVGTGLSVLTVQRVS